MKKFYTSSFNVVKGAEAVQNARVFSIATKVPSDCEGMKTIPELAPGWNIVGPYKKAEKEGMDLEAAKAEYEKEYYKNVLKKLNPDIIPDGSILCCYENSSKFCHRQTVARWATWANADIKYGGELDTAKKVFDVLAKDVQTNLNFEEETIEMKEVNTDTTVTTVAENNIKKEETIEMTNAIENKAAEVREAIETANAAELVKIDATKKYIELRDAARAAMLVKKIATVKKQIANAVVTIKKAEFSVIEVNGKIDAAIEAGKATVALEKRLTKAQERIAKAQDKLAAYEEKLAGLTANAPEAATEQTIEEPAIVEEPVVDEPLFNHVNDIAVAVNLIAEKVLHAELDELDKERIAEGDWIEKDDQIVVEEPAVADDPVVENDDELDLIVETEGDDSEEPEEAVSFAAPKVVKAEGLLKGKTVVGTVEEPKAETNAAAAISLQEIIAKRATVVAAPMPAVKQETVPAPAAPKPFVPVNPFKKEGNVSVAPAPVAKTTAEDDGWVINDPIEFDEEIERDLGRNPDGTKKTWGTWVLEQQAEEIDFDCLNLETDEDGMIIMPDQPVDQWLIHGATGTKDKKKNFRDSFLNNDVYEDIKLENAYNFGDESCTDHDAIMDEIYG